MVSLDPSGIYEELGANPVINAIGSLTLLGGSTPPTEVKEAMEAAKRGPANGLQNRILFHIAHRTNDEKNLMVYFTISTSTMI